jgi:NADH:ubiquinone oxidoreductase subunit 2 (subunit N)
MTIVAFLFVCVAGMLVGLVALPYGRFSRIAGLASLAAALAAALLMDPGDSVSIGEVDLVGSWFSGFFLTTLTTSCLLLCLTGLATGWSERLAPAALATLVGIGVAITASDPTVALVAAAAATAPAALIASRSRQTVLASTVGVAELRTLGLVIGASTLGALTITNTNWAVDDPTFVLAFAFLALAAAVAVRSGAVPFHLPAALLSRSGEGVGLVLSLVWVPSSFALVALSWNASIFGVTGGWLDWAVVAVQAGAIATLVLGAVGAMVHEEVEEVAAYSIVQDAGFILLALTARDAGAAQSARLWLLVFVLAKSALVAWAAAISWAFGTSRLGQLRGWLRRSPILGLALAAIALATLGWPGSDVYVARADLVGLGLPEPLHFVGTAAILLSLAYYLRLLAIGVVAPTAAVRNGAGEIPRLRRAERAEPAEARAAELSRLQAAAAAGDHASDAGRGGAGAEPAPPRPIHRGPSRTHRLATAWRANRALETSLIVLTGAVLAAVLAFGGFGAPQATQSGIALDQIAGPPPAQDGGDNGPPPEATAQATAPPQLSPAPPASAAPQGS